MAGEVTVQGKVNWFKYKDSQVNKYGKLTVDLYPKDKATRAGVSALKLRSAVKEDADGEFFYTFSKKLDDKFIPGPIPVFKDGQPFDGPVGNGSEVKLTLQVYPWDNEHGKGNGAKIIRADIINLVEYKPEVKTLGGGLPVE